jgi:hypothetical protein
VTHGRDVSSTPRSPLPGREVDVRRPLVPIEVIIVCILCVSFAEGCKQSSTDAPAARQDAGSDGSVALAHAPATASPQGEDFFELPEELAVAPHFTGGPAAGKVDVSNRYTSTIMLTPGDNIVWAHCSGILLSQRVALTAASCVCPPRYATPQGRPQKGPIGPSACAERVYMRSVRYSSREDWKSTEEPASAKIRHLQGKVHVHPAFKIELDEQGAMLATQADLAIIILDSPEAEPVESIPFADTEVQENETLVMAGYGDDPRFRGTPWLRFFRHNRATQVHGNVDGRILYEQQGAFVYNGYTGGPCFREDSGHRWLAGIASVGTEQELSFTSTYFFRDWLRVELQRVAEEDLPSKSTPRRP